MKYERPGGDQEITFAEETQLARLAFIREAEYRGSTIPSSHEVYPRLVRLAVNYAVKQEAVNGGYDPDQPDPLEGLYMGNYTGLKVMLTQEAEKLLASPEPRIQRTGERLAHAITALPDSGRNMNIERVRAYQAQR